MNFLSKNAFNIAKSKIGDIIIGVVFEKYSNILPINKLYENKYAIAFWHPLPFWESHIVIVPKKSIKNISSLDKNNKAYISEIFMIIKILVKRLHWDISEYTVTINGGSNQKVSQIHVHLHKGKIIQKV